ncbi:pyridoxal-phosphate dependent enzyme [archaeon]|nr:MAG: pyridoxal-phosphate dependent enzyme [archaeon]
MPYLITTISNFYAFSSSGGNAGHAAAMAGRTLGIPVEIFVPTTTLPLMVHKLQLTGATVRMGGANWNEADQQARLFLQTTPNAQYVHPFDHPLIWEGHATLVDELATQLTSPPDVIVVSVGGGGLLRGIQLGCISNHWTNTKILAIETTGTASFHAAKQVNQVVSLACIDSIATTLGALQVTPSVLDPIIHTTSVVVTDGQAVGGLVGYADECNMLVEPSCGASLSLLYTPSLFEEHLASYSSVVFVVCGGGAVSLDMIQKWRERFGV